MGLRTLLFGLILVAASLFTGWFHWGEGPAAPPVPATDQRVVESTLGAFVATAYGDDGERRSRMEADHLLQYADSDEALLARPRFTLWPADGGPAWWLAAPWGHWQPDAEAEELVLREAVRVRRPAHGERPPLGVDTRDLTVLPAAERARSDAPTVLRSGTAHLRGVGVEFDFRAEQVRLLADVRGFHRDLPEADS